jgi:hypothetical protein
MKKSDRSFAIEIEPPGSAIIGIEEGKTLTIALSGGKTTYTAPIEKVYAAMVRWHQKEHPTGKKRRRLLASSEQLRRVCRWFSYQETLAWLPSRLESGAGAFG